MVPVFAGQTIGELGEITLPDGSSGTALELKLCTGADGSGPVYPDHLYRLVHESLPERFDNYAATPPPEYEHDPALSLWTVGTPRVIVWLRDEWNHPVGHYREARLTLTRTSTGDEIVAPMPLVTSVPFSDTASGVALGDTWLDADGLVSLGIAVAPYDETDVPPCSSAACPAWKRQLRA